jgi:hypothetical protein
MELEDELQKSKFNQKMKSFSKPSRIIGNNPTLQTQMHIAKKKSAISR